jgi:hypothetical protein
MDVKPQAKITISADPREHIPTSNRASGKLHIGFKGMVNRLYNMI